MNMTSKCDATNSSQQIQMTTTCHWMKPPHENFLRTPLPTLNQKERSIVINLESWLFMRNVNVIPNAMKRASSVWNDYQTHMRVRNWWKKLKNHEPNLFLSKSIENFGKKQQLSQHQICCENIRHQKFLSKHQIWCWNIRSCSTAYETWLPNITEIALPSVTGWTLPFLPTYA